MEKLTLLVSLILAMSIALGRLAKIINGLLPALGEEVKDVTVNEGRRHGVHDGLRPHDLAR